MEIGLALFIGLYVGWKAAHIWTKHVINELLEEAGLTPQQRKELKAYCDEKVAAETEEDQRDIIEVKIEKIGDVMYAYTVDEDQFMAQGSTIEQLFQALQERYKEIRFVVREQHGAKFLKESA
jgi:hypothetical protein